MSLMRQFRGVIIAAAATGSLAACAASLPRVDTSTRSFVYGHIESPKPIQRVELVRPLKVRRPSAYVYENGDFFFPDVEPGDWVLFRFMAGNEWYNVVTGNNEWSRQFKFAAKPGGMHFVGAWRVTGVKDNRWTMDEFGFARTDRRSSREILEHMAPELAQTGWDRKAGVRAPAASRKGKSAR